MKKSLKIEILYPEFCNLYGDLGNVLYLENTLKDNAEFIYTNINDKPKFLTNDISLVYIGSMTEKAQKIILKKLLPFKKEIEDKIENNQTFLVTGNAFELFGKYILAENGTKIESLGIFNTYAKQEMMKRWNAFCLAEYEDIEIVGFKSQFTESFSLDNNTKIPFTAKVIRGSGINKKSKNEMIKINNFYATYLLGPLLPVNPLFTKKLLKGIGFNDNLAYENIAIKAYNLRLMEFKNPKKKIDTPNLSVGRQFDSD